MLPTLAWWVGEVVRGGGGAGADDEGEPGVFEPLQVRRGQHACVRDDHDLGRLMVFPEGVQHGQQGERLALVSFELVHLQRESALVHEQPDKDLRVNPALLAHPDPPEPVFALGFEVEGRAVIEHHRQRAVPGGVRVCGRRELRPPVLLHGTGEGTPHRRQRRRGRNPEFVPHSQRVRHARRLHNTCQDEAAERVVADRGEPEPGIRGSEDLPQHPRPRPRHCRRSRHRRHRAELVEIERDPPSQLADPFPRDREQHTELLLTMRGADVLNNRADTARLRHDLHRRRL